MSETNGKTVGVLALGRAAEERDFWDRAFFAVFEVTRSSYTAAVEATNALEQRRKAERTERVDREATTSAPPAARPSEQSGDL